MLKILLLLSFASCSGGASETSRCQHARDIIATQMEIRAKAAIDGVSVPADAAALRAESAREVGALRANFVEVCEKAPAFDAKCLDDTKNMSKECKAAIQPIMKEALRVVATSTQ